MATETVELNFKADLRQLIDAMQNVEGLTSAEAKKMTKSLESAYKSAAKAAKDSARKIEREFNERMGNIKRGAEKVFGGVVGDIDDVVTAISSMGVAGAAAGVALAGLGAAFVQLKLSKFVFASAVESSKDLQANIAALTELMERFRGTIGDEIAPVLQELARWTLAAGLAALDGYRAYLDFRRGIIDTYNAIVQLTGIGELQKAVFDEVREFAGDYLQKADDMIGGVKLLKQAEEERGKAAVKAGEDADEALRKNLDLLSQINAIREEANSDTLTEEDKIFNAYVDRVFAAEQAAAALGNVALAQEAVNAATERYTRDIAALEQKAFNERQKAMEEFIAAAAEARDVDAEAAEERLEKLQEEREEYLRGVQEIVAAYAEAAEQIIGLFEVGFEQAAERRIEAIGRLRDSLEDLNKRQRSLNRGLSEEQREQFADERKELRAKIREQESAALKTFKIMKGLQISQAIVQSAAALLVALADPTTVGPIKAAQVAAVIASTAAAVAKIKNAEPPTFAVGGMVGGGGAASGADTRLIEAHVGEGVVNRRGMQSLGPAGLAALNGGDGVGGTMVVQQVWKGRVVDEVVTDVARSGGRLANEMRRGRPTAGSGNPYR